MQGRCFLIEKKSGNCLKWKSGYGAYSVIDKKTQNNTFAAQFEMVYNII